MEHILTREQMKRCDGYTINVAGVPSVTLMERAARAALDYITKSGVDVSRTLVVCGAGNNGGDGYALALMLACADVNVSYYKAGDADHMTPECRHFYDGCVEAGIPQEKQSDFSQYTLIVDAFIGIGFHGEIAEEAADLIERITASNAVVISLDIPSGVDSNTGAAVRAVRADATVAFAYRKPGHILYPGKTHSGKVIRADIGIKDDAIGAEERDIRVTDDAFVRTALPRRRPDSHKGTYGRVLAIAGSPGMCGAAYLSSLAAYRSVAGLVEVFTSDVNVPIIQAKLPEAVASPWGDFPAALVRERVKLASAVVLGPGLGQSDNARAIVEEVLFSEAPMVIDADALNLIAEHEELQGILRARDAVGSLTVVTPHPAEMARLTKTSVADVVADPVENAAAFAEEYGVICLLKGAVTAISDGTKVLLNTTGCSAMSKGGSGDVLAGVIAALMAQGADALSAAAVGAYLHGRAGEAAAARVGEYSVLASEIADCIGAAIKDIVK